MGSLRRQALGDVQPVDAMHPVEVFGDRAGLVGLDATDEVPDERQVTQRINFRQRLLQVALAKVGDAMGGRGAQPLGAMPLADRHQCDRVHSPVRSRCRSGDLGAQRL